VSPVIPHFELAVERSRSGAHLIRVRGEIHVSTAPEFAARLSEAIDSGETAVVLDMRGVDFIDSTGLSVLLNGLRLVTQQHGRMAIVCANPTVLRLFQVTSLDTTFDIFDDRSQAIAHVTQAPDGPATPTADGSSAGAP
jgi:anti-sigma B factor antagonist